jgi:hypothetical protein
MMRLRAAFALLFQVLLLQVSMLGGGMACAPEWLGMVSESRPAAHAVADHGGTTGHGGHSGHAGAALATHAAHGVAREVAANQPAASPLQAPAPEHGGAPSHCAATTGCAAVAVDAAEVIVASVAVVHESVQVGRVSLPLSTRQAPEPPPPRA